MNTISTYQAAASKSESGFFGMSAAQKGSCGIWQAALWNQQQNTKEAADGKASRQGGISMEHRTAAEPETSIKQSEREHALFSERVQSGTSQESETEKAFREKNGNI